MNLLAWCCSSYASHSVSRATNFYYQCACEDGAWKEMSVVLVSGAVMGQWERRTHGHLRYDAVGSVTNQVQGACGEGRRNGEFNPGTGEAFPE